MATIVIHSGRAWAPWSPQPASLDNRSGLGGSQVAATRLAHALAAREDAAIVVLVGEFSDTQSDTPKVRYEPLARYEDVLREFDTVHLLVVSRYVEYLPRVGTADAKRCARIVFWCHDTEPIGTLDRRVQECHNVLCLSEWHATLVDRIARNHLVMRTNNGLAPHLYVDEPWPNKIAGRFVYSSAIYRGLDKLLDAWPHIRARCAHATLDVYADFDAPLVRQRMSELADRLRAQCNKLAVLGVRICGFVSQSELRRALYECDVWLYPTSFRETYCISALEAQASGALCVYAPLAALPETIDDRGIALNRADLEKSETLAAAVEPYVSASSDQLTEWPRRRRARAWALEQTWDVVAEQFSQFYFGQFHD